MQQILVKTRHLLTHDLVNIGVNILSYLLQNHYVFKT